MTREAARQDAGFYPIDSSVIRQVANKIEIVPGQSITLLDPCMGKGEALKVLVDVLTERGAKVHYYGCELNTERFAEACATFGSDKGLVCGGAEYLDVSPGGVSILYLNPPFDDNGVEQERWLRMSARWVAAGGLLLFVTTERNILQWRTRDFINENYKNGDVFVFPKEHRKFNEVLVASTRKGPGERMVFNNIPFNPQAANLRQLNEDMHELANPAEHAAMKEFSLSVPNLDAVADMMAQDGISRTDKWRDMTRPVSLSRRWRPLRRLSKGHIANMIAAGAFRGMPIVDPVHGKCLLSGYGDKVVSADQREELPDGTIKITRSELPVIYLTILGLEDGKLYEYTSQEPEPMERFIVKHLDALEGSIDRNFQPLFVPEEMLQPYLEASSWFSSPGVLPGATRVKLDNGAKALVTGKVKNSENKVVGYTIQDIDGTDFSISFKDIAHVYTKMLPAQIVEGAAMAWSLRHNNIGGMEIGQMGVGKTSTGLLAMFLAYKEKFMMMKDGSDHRHTIVIMAPGHVCAKWAREARACFANFTWKGGKTLITIPGRERRRIEQYQISADGLLCPKCKTVHDILTPAEKRDGVTVGEKAKNIFKKLQCRNKTCDHMLIDFAKLPLADIEEAFAFQGLSIIILPKDSAKLGASWKGAATVRTKRWRQGGALIEAERVMCPTCGKAITVVVGDEEVPLEPEMLYGKNGKKRKAYTCDNPYERKSKDEDGHVALSPERKIVFRNPVLDDQGQPVYETVEENGRKIVRPKFTYEEKVCPPQPVYTSHNKQRGGDHVCGTPLFQFVALNDGDGRPRTEMTHYIADRHGHEYDMIIDEIHQYKGGGTTQGMGAQVLIANANYSLGLTGTPYGGKASSVFYMLYRLLPSFREIFEHKDEGVFVDRYGVKDTVITIPSEDEYSEFGKQHRKATVRRPEGNGCDPRIIEVFLPYCTFLTLSALHIKLPPRQEEFHWLKMDPELEFEAMKLHNIRSQAVKKARSGAPSMLSVWMNAELNWPLAPDNAVKYIDPMFRDLAEQLAKEGKAQEAAICIEQNTQTWCNGVEFTDAYPETNMVRDIADQVQKAFEEDGDRSIVYIGSRKFYGAKHVYNAMKRRGLRPFILSTSDDSYVSSFADKGDYAKADLEDREDEIADALERGANVLIVNPTLVAEGVDLVQFNWIHVMGLPNWSVYKFAQSLSRCHRPGQEREVHIEFWAYGQDPANPEDSHENHLQALAIRVMSDKMRSANVVTGDIGGALAALNEQAGDIMNEIKDRLVSDKLPTFDKATGSATFSGEFEAMPEFELEIQKIVEQFEDARIGGKDKPKVGKFKAAPKKAAAPKEDRAEPSGLPSWIEDDIAAILGDFGSDEEMPSLDDIPVESESAETATVEPDDALVGDEQDEIDAMIDEQVQRRAMLEDLLLTREINEIPDEIIQEMIDTGVLTEDDLTAYYSSRGIGTYENQQDAAIKKMLEEAARAAESLADHLNGDSIKEEEEVAPSPPVTPKVADDDFGLAPVEEVPEEAQAEVVDQFSALLHLTDDDIAFGPSTVYDDAEDYRDRALPGDGPEFPFN